MDKNQEFRDGAITYLENSQVDEVIMLYQNSPNSLKQEIIGLVKQRKEQGKKLLEAIKELEVQTDSKATVVEVKVEKEEKDEKDEKRNSEQKSVKDEEEREISDEASTDDETDSSEKDISTKLEELEKKEAELIELKNNFMESENSLKNLKGKLLSDCVAAGIMLQARMKYEQAKDNLNYETASYMIEKNIYVAEREAVVLEVNRAIGRGEDLSALQDKLIYLNDKIADLDQTFNNKFPILQAEVASAHKGLEEANKEVIDTVKADFRNSYKLIRNYSEDGILNRETIDMNKDLKRFMMTTSYDDGVVYNGRNGAIDSQTINIEGKVVRVLTQETSMGVDTSFMNGNVMQMSTGIGDGNTYVTRDSNGSLIADDPEIEDALKRIGIENVEDIAAACAEMDQKAEEMDKEEIDEEMPYSTPNQTVSNE